MQVHTKERLCDVANLVVGAGLFLSPWIIGFGVGGRNIPTQVAGISGTAIALLAIAALSAFEVWEEWLIVLSAAGAILSPWVFGFAGTPPMIVQLLAGGTAMGLSAMRLWWNWQSVPKSATSREDSASDGHVRIARAV